jgi:LmbE family N-acetylglucosaminyl deacetylase
MPQTLVFLHAHPDDEALLTAGTMARASSEGQRVVLITATSGEAGLAAHELQDRGLANVREAELVRSARMLGVQRLELLHYADSGLHGDRVTEDGTTTLCQAPIMDIAARVAAVLNEESADVLITYDQAGGYGHPDHIRIHQVGVAAADLAKTRNVFAVTAPPGTVCHRRATGGPVLVAPGGVRPGAVHECLYPAQRDHPSSQRA